MALALADLQSYLTANLPAGTTVQVNWQGDSPDTMVVVSTAGGAIVMDGAFESQHVHIRSRADTDAAAETLALQVHALLVAFGSFAMGGTYVRDVLAATGPPGFLMRDVNQRTTYLATYTFTTPTGVSTS